MYKTFSTGLLDSNTYLVWDEESLEAMVVDCGNAPRAVFAYAESLSLNVKYIVLTHAHYDHAEYLAEYLRLFTKAKSVAHECEIAIMTDSEANVSLFFGTPRNYGYPDMTVREGDILTLGKTEYRVLSTPGHTPGCICLYSQKDKLMFTGDTLFHRGYGRTDFKFGSYEDLLSSLRRLLSMDGDITFLSGHGAPSKIRDEV